VARNQGAHAGAIQQDACGEAARSDARPALLAYRKVRTRGIRILVSSSLRRALVTGGAVIAFLLLAGATYQGVATALERRRFPHPGPLIDVGGHQLHLHCQGRGAPTVVLEAPSLAMSTVWAWVQSDVSKTTKVCSYDRAGLGWSEAGDDAFTPKAVPEQLNTLLHGAKVPGPYILVGAELGAAYASRFASNYPDETAALVLVNPPDAFNGRSAPALSRRFLVFSPWLARAGVLRATRMLSRSAVGLPQPASSTLSAFLNRPDHLTRAATELAHWDESVTMLNAATLRRTLPVTQVEMDGTDYIALLANR